MRVHVIHRKGHFEGVWAGHVLYRDYAKLGVQRRCGSLPNYFGHLMLGRIAKRNIRCGLLVHMSVCVCVSVGREREYVSPDKTHELVTRSSSPRAFSLFPLLSSTLPGPSASEVTL